jgi:hypothetical protein
VQVVDSARIDKEEWLKTGQVIAIDEDEDAVSGREDADGETSRGGRLIRKRARTDGSNSES